MSVNVSVITNIAADVLTVPSSAIQTQGNTSYVLKLASSQTTTVAGQTGVIAKTAPTQAVVQTGVSDGTNTQILSGLNAGDSIVVQSITITSTKSAASSATSALRIGGTGGGGGATRATGSVIP
jgi:multidrug efflux pump subunit AcrA (membrane-fusion protein)